MPETIDRLLSMGLKLAVLSNKPHKQAIEVVQKLYGNNRFDHIQGNVKDIDRKPSPDGALYVADILGLKPEEVIYIGDTSTDMKTGKNAGMYTVGVLWGFRDRDELMNNNADAIISHPHEIIDLIVK